MLDFDAIDIELRRMAHEAGYPVNLWLSLLKARLLHLKEINDNDKDSIQSRQRLDEHRPTGQRD